MDQTTPAKRQCCRRCRRPFRVCYCTFLPSKSLQTECTHVLILQHLNEHRHRQPISSIPVLLQTLDETSVTCVPIQGSCPPGSNVIIDHLLYAIPSRYDEIFILYPDPNATPLSQEIVTRNNKGKDQLHRSHHSFLLVVIDGTWTEAKQLLHANRLHWEHLQTLHQTQGTATRIEFICIDQQSTDTCRSGLIPNGSIYGDLRREPMDGCLSTLEAVALALRVLEPHESGDLIAMALLQSFRGMVSIQTQCMLQGKRNQLTRDREVPIVDKTSTQIQQKAISITNTIDTNNKDVNNEKHSRIREYVLYETKVDFRRRPHYHQYGPILTCSYSDARDQCQALNANRKRGSRLGVLAIEAFINLQQQQKQNV